MSIIQFVLAHHAEIAAGISGILTGVIAIALVIPGDQPEKTLQKVVDLLAKISKK